MNTLQHLSAMAFAIVLALPAVAADLHWANTGTDFNSGASWTGGTAPGPADRAYFSTSMATQPQVTSSKALHSLFFTPVAGTAETAATSACGGYVLSGAPGTTLTLTASGFNWNGVYMMEQCTTGTNVISADLAFPDAAVQTHRYVNLVAGLMEFSGRLSGNSNNVLRVGGTKSATGFVLSGDNTGFTGGFTKASPFPIFIRNAKAVSKLTRLEFSVHGSQAAAASRFVNQTGGPLVFENNPAIFLNGGDGVIIESAYPIDFGSGAVSFNDGNAGRSCPLTISAPRVTIRGPASQASSNNGYVKVGLGTLEVFGPSSYLAPTVVGRGVFLAMHPDAVSPNSALMLARAGATDPGGILGLGCGDFTRTLGQGAGQFYTLSSGGYYNIGGWAAYGADRSVNIGNDLRPVTNSLPFFGSIILGASDADATVTFRNPLHTQSSDWYSYDGAADVDGRFAGAITNYNGATPTIAKRGNGTLELSAVNPLTGTINVYEGRLLVSGSLKTSLNVKNGGALGGSGTLAGDVNVESNGTFSVKNTIGTTTVLKNLIFSDGAKLGIDLDGGNRTGIAFSGASGKCWNYGRVNCLISASNPELASGSMEIIDWAGATTPNISLLDPAKFSIVNTTEFAGTFAVEGSALVLHYRSLMIKPTVIIVR